MSDEAALLAYVRRQLPDSTDLDIVSCRRSTEGFSQETFFFELSGGPWEQPTKAFVAKREPAAGLLEPYDLEPEFRVLHALSAHSLPSPPTPWFEIDPQVFERPFYVMEHLPGYVPIPALKADGSPPLTEAERSALTPQVIDTLAELHALDWESYGFQFLGVPEAGTGAPACELRKWETRIRRTGLEPAPIVAEALHWLGDNLPVANDIGLVHGDYRLGNWLVDTSGEAARLSGVLDWELVHLGDPIEDVAWVISPLWRGQTPWAASLVEPGAFVAAYEERSGRAVDPATLQWYSVLVAVKMIAIMLSGLRAYLDGRCADFRMVIFDHQCAFLTTLLGVLRGWLPESLLENR